MEGLAGRLVVSGVPENGGWVDANYDIGFHGRYPLTGSGAEGAELDISFANTGPRRAHFVSDGDRTKHSQEGAE
jgi:hypothetical protein